MFLLDEDTLYRGEKYSAILAREDDEEAYLQFLQPYSDRLESQKNHDKALGVIFEREEDLRVRNTDIEYELTDQK